MHGVTALYGTVDDDRYPADAVTYNSDIFFCEICAKDHYTRLYAM